MRSGNIVSKLCLLGLLTASCVLSLQSRAQTMNSAPRYLFTDKEAVLLMPAEMIAPQNVSFAQWTPDGRGVLTLRDKFAPMMPDMKEPPPAELTLSLWRPASHRSVEMWRKSFPTWVRPQFMQWVPTTGIALLSFEWTGPEKEAGPDGKEIMVTRQRHGLLWVDTERREAREIDATFGLHADVSPTQPYIVLTDRDTLQLGAEHHLQIMQTNGTTMPVTGLPPHFGLNSSYWSADGSTFYLLTLNEIPDKPEAVLPTWYAINPTTAAAAILPKAPPLPQVPAALPRVGNLSVSVQTQTLKFGDASETISSLWLETSAKSERTRSLIVAEGSDVFLSPKSDAILYTVNGAAWITTLYRMPKEAYKTALAKSSKAVVISNARQVGLGIMMWAQDHDEKMPGPDNINSEINPYLKNDQLFAGFTYLYGGGPLSGIANPSMLVIGQIEGPGGAAMIFADGHVKWQDR